MSGRPRRTPDRQASEQRGRRAEAAAALWLRCKGYAILARRYRCAAGEIDLIVRRANLVAAVEVKARAGLDDAAFSVIARQRERIARATEHFLAANPRYAEHDVRFDAVLVTPRRLPRHVPDAWRID
ncbi:MAG: YraN family protein [Alphaproteobacteria bacterium]|nr:YraN family protein [Alphaproteobacteria bacterium]